MKKLVIRFNAPVVLLFALLSLLVLLLDGWTGGVSTTRFFCVYRSSLADPLTYVRFFGHVLGHSGYSHYMNNMLLLLLVGPGLEEKYGSLNLLMTILATALVTGLVQFIFFPGTALLGSQRCGVHDDCAELLHRDAPGRHPPDHAAGGGPVSGQRGGGRSLRERQHLPDDPIVGGLCGIVFGFSLARAKRDDPL